MKPLHGFTLVELLVVVAIIVLLMAILTPALEDAAARAQLAKCLTQQRGIYEAIHSYMLQNRARMFDKRNRHRWHPGTPGAVDETKYIAYTHGSAYWGAAYRPFGAVKKMFNCPAATDAQSDFDLQFNDWSDGSWAAGHIYTTYGFNGIIVSFETPFFTGNKSTAYTTWHNPSEMLMFMDTFESSMEGDGDAPYKFNQAEWLSRPSAKQQNYRHFLGPAMAWADGHASHYQPKFGWEPGEINGDFPIRWFKGE